MTGRERYREAFDATALAGGGLRHVDELAAHVTDRIERLTLAVELESLGRDALALAEYLRRFTRGSGTPEARATTLDSVAVATHRAAAMRERVRTEGQGNDIHAALAAMPETTHTLDSLLRFTREVSSEDGP